MPPVQPARRGGASDGLALGTGTPSLRWLAMGAVRHGRHIVRPREREGCGAAQLLARRDADLCVDPSVSATVFFDAEGVVFVNCSHALAHSLRLGRRPVPAWLVQKQTRWLPPYIRLASDEHGVPVYPKLRVTALVERRARLGQADPDGQGH
jgi:hypothetical protein